MTTKELITLIHNDKVKKIKNYLDSLSNKRFPLNLLSGDKPKDIILNIDYMLSPLKYASYGNHLEVVELFLCYLDSEEIKTETLRLMPVIIEKGLINILRLLFSKLLSCDIKYIFKELLDTEDPYYIRYIIRDSNIDMIKFLFSYVSSTEIIKLLNNQFGYSTLLVFSFTKNHNTVKLLFSYISHGEKNKLLMNGLHRRNKAQYCDISSLVNASKYDIKMLKFILESISFKFYSTNIIHKSNRIKEIYMCSCK